MIQLLQYVRLYFLFSGILTFLFFPATVQIYYKI